MVPFHSATSVFWTSIAVWQIHTVIATRKDDAIVPIHQCWLAEAVRPTTRDVLKGPSSVDPVEFV